MEQVKLKSKILVADDTPFTINILKEALENEGYQLFIATSGEKALIRAEQNLPDIILLDVLMPDVDGFEVCRRLKKSEKTKDIPVIFMTGLASVENKIRGFEAGAVDYVTKPIEIEEVLSRIRTQVSIRNMQRELKAKNDQLENEINIRRIAEEEIRELNSELEKRVEERTHELAQVNRMLKILSECNQVLVRADSEDELLKKICSIIVDYGGYPLVQVGFADKNESGNFIVKEQLSFNNELLDVVGPFWNELNTFFKKDGNRLNVGEPFIARNIHSDTRFSFWKESAVFFDSISFIALPLRINGITFGALGIYTSRLDAFESEEVTLLLELASDVSYGIKSIREQLERQKAEEVIRFNEIRLSALLALNEMRDATVTELANYVMEQGVKLTQSEIGYIAIGNEDRNKLIINACSTTEHCKSENLIQEINKMGLFEEAIHLKKKVITNNCSQTNFLEPGDTEGDINIKNHLSVPLFDNGKLAILVGVGNKRTDYNESDIQQLELLIYAMWRLYQKRKAEEELRLSEERWHRIIEYNPACILLFSEEKVVYSNNAWLKLVGATDFSEVTNKPLDEFIHPEYKEIVTHKITSILNEDKPSESFEEKIIKKNGEQVYAEATAIPINFMDKKAVMKVCWDITERKSLVNELISAKEKAERADELKSEFLAQISHEVRSPLNVILSFSRLLQTEIQDRINEDLKESFTSIDLAGKRIIRTVDLILNMAELQTGTYVPIYKKFDLKGEILESVKQQYRLNAEMKNLQFVFSYDTNETELLADGYSIEQIFTNLVDNAIKYTIKGKVEVTLDRDEKKRLRVRIIDTGIGIADDYLPRLFEPFSQEDQGYNRKFEGNGLGLALVKRYCVINNANIYVDSKKEVGSTFTVIFN